MVSQIPEVSGSYVAFQKWLDLVLYRPRLPQQAFVNGDGLHALERAGSRIVEPGIGERDSSLQEVVRVSSYVLSLGLSCSWSAQAPKMLYLRQCPGLRPTTSTSTE